MGLWSRLIRWRRRTEAAGQPARIEGAPSHEAGNTVELPSEPFVFECQSCGKVFEARRLRPLCPECDSRDVSLVSE
jgi:Zn finger protein HypA/HybF involved in hydrogenase expression